jgi:peptidoglycan glycosyltransferase
VSEDTTGAYEGLYLNRFTQSVYIPGSIFKIATTAAALECVPGIEDMSFQCTGTYAYGIDKVSCEKAHGTTTLKTAMAKSCNCSYAQIVKLIGRENLQKYVDRYQVTQSVKFDGITTAKGNFDLNAAAAVSVAWAGIGQYTDQINPCSFMTFMGTIASGGKGAVPYLVEKVSIEEETTYEAQTQMTDRIMSEEIAETLREYMRNNVVSVYGADNFPGLKVCAKSGTSQVGGGKTSNAMFAGFVDDEAYPLAFVVVVENGGYGSSTCVPVLREVLAACKKELDAT